MGLLRDIQNGSTEDSVPLATVLRRCQVLAARHDLPELAEWVRAELNGYPSKDSLPDYRTYPASVMAHFVGPMWNQMTREIPQSVVPQDYREWAFTMYLIEGVSHYEPLLDSADAQFQIPLDPDFVAHYLAPGKVFADYGATSAWRVLTKARVKSFLDVVRNRVLAFALEIEKRVPNLVVDDEAELKAAEVHELARLVKVEITGGTNTLAIANQTVMQTVKVGEADWESLRVVLIEAGVPEDELPELKNALDEERSIGRRTMAWLMRAGGWTLNGVAPNAAGSVLGAFILRYLGVG